MKSEYTEYSLTTTLPRWAVKWIDSLIIIVARLSGHSVIISSVKRAGDDNEQE